MKIYNRKYFKNKEYQERDVRDMIKLIQNYANISP